MQVAQEVEDQTLKTPLTGVAKLNHTLARYIPVRETWTPADEALYKPPDLYRVPMDEARAMQLRAIKYAFTRHYNSNGFYREYCETRGVAPDDITTNDDLLKIPLIPDLTFKQYPEGRDFARWIAGVYTGDLPQVTIKGSHPTFDEMINAFNASGLVIAYSSGTSGRFTFIPRDQRTFLASQYCIAKSFISMWEGDIYATDAYLLLPNPAKTNVFIGKVTSVLFDLIANIEMAIDRKLTTKTIQTAMTSSGGLRSRLFAIVQKRTQEKTIGKIIHWLEQHDEASGKLSLIGAPYLLYSVMKKLQAEGKSFDLGEDSFVLTGGGWKVQENVRLATEEFRQLVNDVLGIPEASCLDLYGMVEGNGWMVQCPEGHYLHAPYTFYKPIVVNKDLQPAQEGEPGRFAFLDALAESYPGFIITGDEVRMFEHCPVCDRPGPVLEPEVHRAQGEELRGCAEELRRALARDVTVATQE
jgi:hypothetical protein